MTCSPATVARGAIPQGPLGDGVPEGEGGTVALLDPRVLEVLTGRVETDATTALVRGLAEYLASLDAEPTDESPDGGMLFRKVVDTWADVEQTAEYPSAAVFASDTGIYDEERFTPETIDLDTPQGDVLRHVAELTTTLTIELWTTDRIERVRVVHALEDSLNPADWMVGVRLMLPHYHGAHATFRFQTVQYFDDETSAQLRRRRAALTVEAATSVYVRARAPTLRVVQVGLTVE